MLKYEDFLRYHKENPEVYKLFARFTYQVIDKGRKRFGAKMIMERIRWYTNIETKGEVYKVSNNYTAFYSRLFEKRNKKYKGFFGKRKSIADRIKYEN